jgi:cytochrome P450 PksS
VTQLERLRDDPSLVPSAVEEILRFRSPIQLALARAATEDVELDGVAIPAGATVLVALAAMNRTPKMFAEPDRFDVGRTESRHMAFGFGPHYCLGANLARAELIAAFDGIVRRLPGLRLGVDIRDVPWRMSELITAPATLPVVW